MTLKAKIEVMNRGNTLYGVIIAGGSGTRFWPLSREETPKQLLSVDGRESLIQATVSRITPVIPLERIYIVTNQKQVESINFQLHASTGRGWDTNFIIEPEAKNTAPAIGLAAIYLRNLNPCAIMAVLPSDHIIRGNDKFCSALLTGAEIASQGYLVTIGIKPNTPDTGYGYIKVSSEKLEVRSKGYNCYKVERFIEKPNIKTAERCVREGNYYWNSGIFIWKAEAILSAIEKYMPHLYNGLKKIEKTLGSGREEKTIRAVFPELKPESIDYGVLEKAKNVAILPVGIGWSDVGSWHALWHILHRDSNNNVKHGNVISIDNKNSILYCGKRVVGAIGLKDMVVVDTPDATLICPKDRTQDVRKIVDILKKRGAEEYVTHKTVFRPWGSYTVLERGNRFKVKKIEVKPGTKLSHQMHRHRSEHWVVVAGTARVTNGDRVYDVHPNESTFIPMSTKHRLENPGKIPLEIIEVQNGEYLEEDDIIRFEDEYKRKTEK